MSASQSKAALEEVEQRAVLDTFQAVSGMRAAIAGDRVRATKAEMTTEPTTAMANSINSRPVVLF